MAKLSIIGMDPSFRNWGYAFAEYCTESGNLEFHNLNLITTQKTKLKNVRASSDDLATAQTLHKELVANSSGIQVAFAEIPSGSQSASAARKLGIATGVLASCSVPLFEVTPIEVKLASIGNKKATKKEMIDWAVEKHPDLPWIRHKSKGEMVLNASNEHLADSVAVVYAGIQLKTFNQLVSMLKGGINEQ